MMSKMTIYLSYKCSATYAIFIIWDNLFFKTILVYLKYLIELSKSNGSKNKIVLWCQTIFLTNNDSDI